ncbi:MAG: hypothetical protein IJF74_05285 [Clostridia bacterium]|nr:hypothetical protein [Clostridia bacterium]
MKKVLLSVSAVIIAVFIVLFAWYFAVGSLEMVATPEKTAQTREACAAIIFVLSVTEAVVAVNLIKAFRK